MPPKDGWCKEETTTDPTRFKQQYSIARRTDRELARTATGGPTF